MTNRDSLSPVGLLLIVVLGVAADAHGDSLIPRWLYNPADRPAVVSVAAPEYAEVVTLTLMDHDGNLHAEPIVVEPGDVDLTIAMPIIRRLRRAAYLQLIVDSEPVGSALVVQPMLSRLVPVVEDAVNPSGIKYTKIVGWRDEALEGDDVPIIQTPPRPEDPWLANHSVGTRLYAGLRIYPERDVRLETDQGAIHLVLRPDDAPNTAWNFLELARGGFFRGIPFHRIVPMTPRGDPFVIQAGDPTPSGSGGPGYWLPMEPSTLPHTFGVISMARDADPDSAGSQIFICLSRAGTARLDGHYCAFGYAVDSTETILAIASVELDDVAAGRPAVAPMIIAAEIMPAPARRPGVGRPDQPSTAIPTPPAPTPERVPR